MDPRRQKAHELADRARITFADGCYTVPSQSGNGSYTVILDDQGALCDCLDFELRGEPGKPCKHVLAARLWRDRQARGVEQDKDNVEPSPKPKRKTYPQQWVEYNVAQTNEGRHFGELLADLCRTVEEPPRPGRGRKPVPLADQVFAATMKVSALFSARRFMSQLEECHSVYLLDRPSVQRGPAQDTRPPFGASGLLFCIDPAPSAPGGGRRPHLRRGLCPLRRRLPLRPRARPGRSSCRFARPGRPSGRAVKKLHNSPLEVTTMRFPTMRKLLFALAGVAGLTLVGASWADVRIEPRPDIAVPLGRVKPMADGLPLERPNAFCPPWPRTWPWPKPRPPLPRPQPFPDPYPWRGPYDPCFRVGPGPRLS